MLYLYHTVLTLVSGAPAAADVSVRLSTEGAVIRRQTWDVSEAAFGSTLGPTLGPTLGHTLGPSTLGPTLGSTLGPSTLGPILGSTCAFRCLFVARVRSCLSADTKACAVSNADHAR